MTDTTGKYEANQPPTMMMASFRIDRDLYTKFGAIAKRERLTVTDVLTGYIQSCTDNDRTEYGVSTDTYDTDNVMTRTDVLEIVNTAFDELTSKLISLEMEVDYLKKFESIVSV